MSVTLEDAEKFYRFLQGEVPETLTLRCPPNLSKEQAFAVIYYLQEELRIFPDHYEQCREPSCRDLFDSNREGCPASFCDACCCQYPDGFDPEECADGCDGCPLVIADMEGRDENENQNS